MIGDSLSEFLLLLQDHAKSVTAEINTCLPGRVVSYDRESQTASVRLTIKRPMKTNTGGVTSEELPVLPRVPVAFPRAGNLMIHMDIDAGDYVLVVFTQWDIGEFHRTGEDSVDPCTHETHGLGGAVAIAGFSPSGLKVDGLNAAEILMGKPGGSGVRVTESKVMIGNAANPYKKAAREGDQIKFTVSPALAAALIAAPMTGVISVAPGPPVEITGTIASGSSSVDVAD